MNDAAAVITGFGGSYGGPAAGLPAASMSAFVSADQFGKMLYYEPKVDVERYISRAADRRAMGFQFQWGVAAASQALERAGVMERASRADISLFVASRAGERDSCVDQAILAELAEQGDIDAALNYMLMERLRPTLFLGQIPNLLAGNIAILLGTKGPSRTFLGEEAAGACAVEAGYRAVTHGRCQRALVGGSLNAGRESLLRWFYASGAGAKHEEAKIWRESEVGAVLGGGAGFVLLEGESSASTRDARPIARLRWLGSWSVDWYDPPSATTALAQLWASVAERKPAIISNAMGKPRIEIEAAFWKEVGVDSAQVVNSVGLFGATLEADASLSIIAATMWLTPGAEWFPPVSACLGPTEVGRNERPRSCLVVTGSKDKGLFGCLIEVAE